VCNRRHEPRLPGWVWDRSAKCRRGLSYGYGGVGWGGGFGWRHGWAGGAWGWDYPYVYQEGVIGVDIYDGKSKQALWHASVDQNLVGATGDKAEKKIRDATEKWLSGWKKSATNSTESDE